MLIKRLLLVALITTTSMNVFGAPNQAEVQRLSQYGVQSNKITMADLNAVLNECKQVTDWNNATNLPLSSILRAQLSNDTTMDDLGNSATFATLFPGNPGIAAQFKTLVSATASQSQRLAAITAIEAAMSPAAAPVAVGNQYDLIGEPWLNELLLSWGLTPTGDISQDINMANAGGATPLINAAANNYSQFVEFALAHGADKNATMPDGNRAIDLTTSDTVKSLLNS